MSEVMSEYFKTYYQNNKESIKKRSKTWREQNREKHRAYSSTWAKSNPERHNAQNKKWAKENPDKMKKIRQNVWRKWKYNLTPEQFADILTTQNARCGICKSAEPRHKNGWCVDHSHETQEVRGILCNYCNVVLGWYETKGFPVSKEFLEYVENPPAKAILKVELKVIAGGKK